MILGPSCLCLRAPLYLETLKFLLDLTSAFRISYDSARLTTAEPRKLEYDYPPIPKPRKEGTRAKILPGPCFLSLSNIPDYTVLFNNMPYHTAIFQPFWSLLFSCNVKPCTCQPLRDRGAPRLGDFDFCGSFQKSGTRIQTSNSSYSGSCYKDTHYKRTPQVQKQPKKFS